MATNHFRKGVATVKFAITGFLVTALVAVLALPASAEPVDASLAITINALSGQHVVGGGTADHLSVAPIPLGELAVRQGGESIRVEGLPAVTLRFQNSGSDGAQSTQLSIFNATYRHAFVGGWSVGVGQTVYNQSTTYAPTFPGQSGEVQYSRVTGARFEVGRIAAVGRSTIEAWFAANPGMHGVQYSRLEGSSGSFAFILADPETATQIDTEARVAYRIAKHGELLYGLRYINYVARYDRAPGLLADRNVGFAPVVGYRVHL